MYFRFTTGVAANKEVVVLRPLRPAVSARSTPHIIIVSGTHGRILDSNRIVVWGFDPAQLAFNFSTATAGNSLAKTRVVPNAG